METNDFDYELPPHLIAQFPSEKRDDCRLLHLQRRSGAVGHHRFGDLPGLLTAGDRLVFNDTKVLPARVLCRKETGGAIEVLFTERITDGSWKALVKPSKRIRKDSVIAVEGEPRARLRVGEAGADGERTVSLCDAACVAAIDELLERYGRVPLPHYIKRPPGPPDWETYQTVFAKEKGAIASPTAGLHFTAGLMGRLEAAGIAFSFVTLHVGIGTFRPVTARDPRNHVMHEERYVLTPEAAERISETRRGGGRIIAVGTTVVRVLEHCSREAGYPVASSGKTRLMVVPGYRFKAVDGMITNFHVPRSTLLMLVCAFAGKDSVFGAYREAIERGYRFFSYGDAMIIL
jgi:S-adenosylmethionine:tRNA ribosyltransferase-isomerase